MPYYCHLASSGDIDGTNLQLYSLEQAAAHWNDMIKYSQFDETGWSKQRRAFILSCLGLSLTQLLGQNSPAPAKNMIGDPEKLLSALLVSAPIDRLTSRRLKATFKDFLTYYSAVRHFGKNKEDANYRKLEKLTVHQLERFRAMTLEVWDVLISLHRKNKRNDIDDFRSISEVVLFNALPSKP